MGGTYSARSKNLAYDRCINLFAEGVEDKISGKEVAAFFGCPGLTSPLVTVGNGPIRGGDILGANLYVVSGPSIYQISLSWGSTLLGAMTTSVGPVSVKANQTQVMFSDGVTGMMWNTATSSLTTVSSFPTGGLTLAYQDGYMLTNVVGTQFFYQSKANNVGNWTDTVGNSNGLNCGQAESDSSNIVTIFDLHREVWVFKVPQIEIWINADLPEFRFQMLQGVTPQTGCIAPFSPALVGDTLMWLGQNDEGAGVVYQTNGYRAERRSTHAIEHAWQSYPTMADAISYSYQQEGHNFYVLTFPQGDATWVFDVNSGLWHERSAMDSNGQLHRHWGNFHAYFNGKHVIGDYRNGNLYAFDLDTYTDNGSAKKWIRTWRAFASGNQPYEDVEFNALQIDMQKGILNPLSPALSLPGTSGSYASTPSVAAFNIVGDIDIRARIDPYSWTPSSVMSIVSKRTVAGNQQSYDLQLTAPGLLNMRWSANGSTQLFSASTIAVPGIVNTPLWVRATLDVDDGAGNNVVTFYTSIDGVTWDTLGTAVTTAGTTSIFSSTANVEIGAREVGTLSLFTGNIDIVQIYNGINGTLAGMFCASDGAIAATTITSAKTGEIYTIHPTASIIGTGDTANPQMSLRWSNDGGHNWSNSMTAPVGKTGQTAGTVRFKRLGSTSQSKGRDRVFELSSSDVYPVALIAADMDAAKA